MARLAAAGTAAHLGTRPTFRRPLNVTVSSERGLLSAKNGNWGMNVPVRASTHTTANMGNVSVRASTHPTGFRYALLALGLLFVVSLLSGALAAQDTTDRDLARVIEGTEEQPWLRINAGGHTGSVRALAFTPDSARLCSAGLDKDVQVWNVKAAGRDLQRVLLRERTIRWQVGRGLRGAIYAVADSPSDGLLAVGGYGAMGSLGEILLVDPLSGTLSEVLETHRQTVCSLAFSPDGAALASSDVEGRAVLWKRPQWQPVQIRDPDDKSYGADKAELIAKQPKLRPIAFVGNNQVVLPTFDGVGKDSRLQWKLRLIGASEPGKTRLLDTIHYGMVTALAASADGNWLASADLEGNFYLWDLGRNSPPQTLKSGAVVLSLAFSGDARTLIAGTAVVPSQGSAKVQIWNVATRSQTTSRSLPDHVYACAVSRDGQHFAYVGGKDNEVYVDSLPAGREPVALRGTGRRILKVAFAAREPYYRVAFGTEFRDRGFNDNADLQESFDAAKSSLGDAPVKPDDWLGANWQSGGWSAKPAADGSLQLYQNGAARGRVSLKGQVGELDEGDPRCYCWLPDKDGKPFAVIVGTGVQNSVYVCKLADQGVCPILRHFRGHGDFVASVGVSRDLKYAVSGSADGSLMFWSLVGCEQGKSPPGRWGAELAVQGDRLVVTAADPAGPLYGKGVRAGDTLTEIRWPSAAAEHAEKTPAAMLKTISDMPWGTQVVFCFTRGGVAVEPFQLLPAWRPLATLFVAAGREWAFWTPEGYYDSSVNGYRLFGWQVNRGLKSLPDFYRADQFYKKLERPDVMQKLLAAGSLSAAFQQAAVQPPSSLQSVLPEQIAATPKVEILSPGPGKLVREDSAAVRARVTVPGTWNVVQAKAFANGVVARERQLVDQRDLGKVKELTYQWNIPLPRDERELIQVVVGTDAPTSAFGDVIIERPVAPATAAARVSKLYILAAGIDKYADPDIQGLKYSVADAEAVVKTLQDKSKNLYTVADAVVLRNDQMTLEGWKKALATLKEKLKAAAEPDDLVLLFLAGHGVIDETTKKYYYVGYDMKLSDYQKGEYGRCVTWDDFHALDEVPCRKVALLDTCHSGAIQPLRTADLKAAVRQLQEDVIFTVTASTGDQRSAEKPEWGHGAFTKCLLQAFDGLDVKSPDGIIRLNQAVSWVRQAVPKLTDGLQTPTAAPDDILPYTSLPLTRVK
jgi:WD40 repeat protein